MDDEEREAEYTRAVGHPPRNTDDPDWLYTGTAKEREALRERLGIPEESDVSDGQLELW